ncbi:MAG: Ferredoxin [Syntrophomonadaceae bacterium]|nr:Ferredoxin [Bacillota bacterium]
MKDRYLRNVATLRLLDEKCFGCGRCAEVCPHRVFIVEDKKVRIKDKDGCMECGACAKNCPVNAITVKAGVGCAYAVIMGWLTGSEPSCDCSGGGECC